MIGLILGDTEFPKIIVEKLVKKKIEFFIIDLSKNNQFKNFKNSYRVSIGKFGSIINIIKMNKSNKVLFAGKIFRPNLLKLRLDFKSILHMPNIIKASKIGDAAIVKYVIKILENENIKVISSNYFNPELTLKSGLYTNLRPNNDDLLSIKKGVNFLNNLNSFDHVQAVVVNKHNILATEGRGGTKKMLSKIVNKSNGILIKFPKKKQDLRIDLPTVGLETLKDCKRFKIKGIILKSKKNIFLNKNMSIKFANQNKIFIKVI
jgi:DUF1009 family protein